MNSLYFNRKTGNIKIRSDNFKYDNSTYKKLRKMSIFLVELKIRHLYNGYFL